MIEGFWLWLSFGLLAATTLITRGSFIMAGEKGRLPAVLQRALRYAPAAALAALVAPDLLRRVFTLAGDALPGRLRARA